jgi:hypothetical protein
MAGQLLLKANCTFVLLKKSDSMSIQIQLSPKLEQQLRETAAHEGLAPENYVLKIVKNALQSNTVSARFETLFQQWKRETFLSSSGSEITNHHAYQSIIEMGQPVVPFILIKLKEDPQHLFYALFKITGENPVQPEHAGSLSKMAADWLEWGVQKGYLN